MCTVAEMIEYLQQLPPEAVVECIESSFEGYDTVTRVVPVSVTRLYTPEEDQSDIRFLDTSNITICDTRENELVPPHRRGVSVQIGD